MKMTITWGNGDEEDFDITEEMGAKLKDLLENKPQDKSSVTLINAQGVVRILRFTHAREIVFDYE